MRKDPRAKENKIVAEHLLKLTPTPKYTGVAMSSSARATPALMFANRAPAESAAAASAARAAFFYCSAVVVELERNADNVIAFGLEHCGGDGRIDAARHGDHDTRVAGGFVKAE